MSSNECVNSLSILGILKNSKYSSRLLGSSKSAFMSGLPLNRKCGHSALNLVHVPFCMSLSSLALSSSPELTLLAT
jgi:hypothetical protein